MKKRGRKRGNHISKKVRMIARTVGKKKKKKKVNNIFHMTLKWRG